MAENDNAIPFSKLVEAVGCSEDELLERLAGILSKRSELPPELIDNRYRCPASGDVCEAATETARLRTRVKELEAALRPFAAVAHAKMAAGSIQFDCYQAAARALEATDAND